FYKTGTVMEGTCLRLADAVYSSSACSAHWCAREYGLSGEIPVIHTGVDTDLFAPLGSKNDRPTVIFVGRLTADKGVPLLVEACGRLLSEIGDLQLRLLGRGDEDLIQELRTIATRFGGPDFLDLPGFVARENLPAQLRASHVFAGPSIHEPGPG